MTIINHDKWKMLDSDIERDQLGPANVFLTDFRTSNSRVLQVIIKELKSIIKIHFLPVD